MKMMKMPFPGCNSQVLCPNTYIKYIFTVVKMSNTKYDKREVFEKKCRPVLEDLSKVCRFYGIPFFFTCCVANDSSGSQYVNEVSGAEGRGISLSEDRIAKHLGITMGLQPLGLSSEDFVMDDVDYEGIETFDYSAFDEDV